MATATIEYRETVMFDGKAYNTRSVCIKEFGYETIASETLEEKLLNDGAYVSEEAQEVDEGIFFYVPDAILNGYTGKELSKYVEQHCE